jgi:ABC-2 type transport system permease protein
MIAAQDIKGRMQYRVDFYVSTIGMLATNAAGLASFWILFNSIPSLNGWNYYELVFMYSFALLAFTPLQLFFDNIWNLSRYVSSGDFIKFYFRPINIFFYYISEVFDLKGLSQLVFAIGTLCFAWAKLGIPVTFLNLLLVIVEVLSASLVMIGLMVLASASAFWIIYSTSVLNVFLKLKDFASYPVTIFNSIFKFVFTFLIPIAFISYYPSQLLIRPEGVGILTMISPVIGVICFSVGYLVWMKGTKSYMGTGS